MAMAQHLRLKMVSRRLPWAWAPNCAVGWTGRTSQICLFRLKAGTYAPFGFAVDGGRFCDKCFLLIIDRRRYTAQEKHIFRHFRSWLVVKVIHIFSLFFALRTIYFCNEAKIGHFCLFQSKARSYQNGITFHIGLFRHFWVKRAKAVSYLSSLFSLETMMPVKDTVDDEKYSTELGSGDGRILLIIAIWIISI